MYCTVSVLCTVFIQKLNICFIKFFSHPSASETLLVPLASTAASDLLIEVWGETCRGRDLGPEAGRWLCQVILGKADGGLRLVQHAAGASSRPDKPVNLHLSPLGRSSVDKPYFADGYPFMMMTQPSVENLNQKLSGECAARSLPYFIKINFC